MQSKHRHHLLYLSSILLISLTLLFCAAWAWQSLHPAPIQNRHRPQALQEQLTRGLGWLRAALVPLKPGVPTSSSAICDTPAPSPAVASSTCTLARLNQMLATDAAQAQAIQSAPQAELRTDVDVSARWLLRHSQSASHALSLIDQAPSTAAQVSRGDPFRLPGCLFLPDEKADSPACPAGKPVDLSSVTTPPGIADLLHSADAYRQALRGASPNTLNDSAQPGQNTPFVQGRHLGAAWHTRTQQLAQQLAQCYTGDAQACQPCPGCDPGAQDRFYEAARARAVGVLVLDVASGRIEAAASAHTPCYAADQLGASEANRGCPQWPASHNTPAASFRLGNQALTNSAMPGSEVKVPIALGLLQAGLSAKEQSALPDILVRSASEDLIDLVLCRQQGFDAACIRKRLQAIHQMARQLGWTGRADVLTGGQMAELRTPLFTGRMLGSDQANADKLGQATFPVAGLKACANRPVKDRWRHCQGADLINTLAELWGTGNAQLSPLGLGNAWLQLAAAANGQQRSAAAHLLAQVQRSDGSHTVVNPGQPTGIDATHAQRVLNALVASHQRGTAHSACVAARQTALTAQQPWAINCDDDAAHKLTHAAGLAISGKTGTPKFPDQDPLPAWRAQCQQALLAWQASRPDTPAWYAARNKIGDCRLRPLKWYALAVGLPGSAVWDKVVVVLAERNFDRHTGLVDSRFDLGPNVAAEIGLSLANTLWGQP